MRGEIQKPLQNVQPIPEPTLGYHRLIPAAVEIAQGAHEGISRKLEDIEIDRRTALRLGVFAAGQALLGAGLASKLWKPATPEMAAQPTGAETPTTTPVVIQPESRPPSVQTSRAEPAATPEREPQTLEDFIRLIPRQDDLVRQGKLSPDVAAWQKERIQSVRQNTKFTLADYKNLKVDENTYINIFGPGALLDDVLKRPLEPHPYFGSSIKNPWRIVLHWGGKSDTKNITDMATGMLKATRKDKNGNDVPDRRNMHWVIDGDTLFRTTPKGRYFKGAHAPGANDDSIGLEIRGVDGVEDLTPELAKMIAMSVVYVASREDAKIPLGITTFWTHYEVDMYHNNPGYDRKTGKINGNIQKFDWPQDAKLDLFLPLIMSLDEARKQGAA